MPRFFIGADQITENTATVLGDDARHIARSLRLAVGDTVTLCSEGYDLSARLTKIRDEECEAEIISREKSLCEPPSEITLFMAYPKGDKLELVVQKAVELGASRIVPFESSRCIKRPPQEKSEKITARLSKIAAEAAKQCGRGIIPTVLGPISFTALCGRIKSEGKVLFCYEKPGCASIKEVLDNTPTADRLAVVIGSEGGFSEEEADRLVSEGAVAVTLGKRILRCETAPIFALSAICYRYEL